MNQDLKKLKVINEQMFATSLFIGTLIVSLTLSYNEKRNIKNIKPLFSKKQAKKIAVANRIAVVLIVLFYFYIDKENINIAHEKHQDDHLPKLQLVAEVITIVTALLALYITVKSNNEFVEFENPNI